MSVTVGRATVHHGDCLEVLPGLAAESVDAVVTDPPAGIFFMGKHWDGNRGGRDAWIAWMRGVASECLRVAKPGAHALVWALPRTSHWTATAWEDGGWQVRDRVAFLHACGFPKNASSLKPAVEDWWLLRKPLRESSIAAQVLATGTGALNVDAARVPCEERDLRIGQGNVEVGTEGYGSISGGGKAAGTTTAGRWPPNCAHDGSPEVLAAFAAFGTSTSGGGQSSKPSGFGAFGGGERATIERVSNFTDTGTAARFFFSAKADTDDRAGSSHPTIKPLALMEWLVRLVTPPGGTVLDPFAGTGVTGEACLRQGFHAVLIEREADYHRDAVRRLGRLSGADTPLFAEEEAA